MVCLKAPEGCRHYSYEGQVFDVGSDGLVDVPVDRVAALRPHGFRSPEELAHIDVEAKDEVKMSRDDLHEMLGHLGIAVADTTLPAIKMVEMLKAAVKAKASAVAKAEADLAGGVDKAAADVKGDDKSQKKRG
jgi:formate-dependent nitrite reductase cytochrome c552 subunit